MTDWGSLGKQLLVAGAIQFGIRILTDRREDADIGKPQAPESDPTKHLPLFWGTCRVPINVFRVGKIYPEPVKEDKSFFGITYGSYVTGYKYRLTAMGWISHGTLCGFNDIIINGTKFLNKLGPQTSTGTVFVPGVDPWGNPNATAGTVSVTGPALSLPGSTPFNPDNTKWPTGFLIGMSAQNLFGDGNGVQGLVRIYPGDGSHQMNAAMQALNTAEGTGYLEPTYREWAYIVFENTYLSRNPQLPSVELVLARAPINLTGSSDILMAYPTGPFALGSDRYPTAPFGPTGNGNSQGDANGVSIVYEMLTSHKTGIGLPNALVDRDSFVAAALIVQTERLGVSPFIDEMRASEEDVNELLRIMDAVLYFDMASGKIKIRLLRKFDGDPDSLPVLDANNLTDFEWRETALNQNTNVVEVEFTNAYKNLLKDVVKAQNMAAIQQANRQNRETVSYPWVTMPYLAGQLAQRELRVRSSVLGRGTFTGNRTLFSRTPGEFVRVVWQLENGTLLNKICRIGEINYGTLRDGKISGALIEDYWSLEASSYVVEPPEDLPTPGQVFIAPRVQVEIIYDVPEEIDYNLILTDPQSRMTAVEYAIQWGTDAVGPWVADSGSPWTYLVTKDPTKTFRAFWRVTYDDAAGTSAFIMGEFPQPSITVPRVPPPVLSAQYSGTDVIITATVGTGVTGVRFATAINSLPSQAAVEAGTLDSTGPYAITVTAPVGTEVLNVGALATNGTDNSAIARLTIYPQPIATSTAKPILDEASTIFPDGRVLTDSATATIDRSVPGIAKINVVGGGGGGGTGSPIDSYLTATFTTSSLADGASEIIAVDFAKSVAFQEISTNFAAWVRIHPTNASATGDLGRAYNADPVFGSDTAPILEAGCGLGSYPLTAALRQNVVSHNMENPRQGRFFAIVTNKSGATRTITTNIKYLPLEGESGVTTGDFTAGLIYHYDAQALTGLANNDPLTAWPMVTGSGDTTNGGTPYPVYDTTGINGKPSVKFVGARFHALPVCPAFTEAEVFVVARRASGGDGALYQLGNDGFPTNIPYTLDGAAAASDNFARNGQVNVGNVGKPTNVGFIWNVSSQTDEWTVRVNGTQIYQTLVNTVVNRADKQIGGYNQGGFFQLGWNGWYGEFRVYNSVLSDSDRDDVNFVLSNKWLVSL